MSEIVISAKATWARLMRKVYEDALFMRIFWHVTKVNEAQRRRPGKENRGRTTHSQVVERSGNRGCLLVTMLDIVDLLS